MHYRKITADKIFDGFQFLEQQVLLTSADGVIEAVLPLAEAGEGVERLEGILSPGFINCHCHLELSHMKGILPERTGLVDFVYKVVTQRTAPEEEILEAIARAEAGMKAAGIVAVGDICNNALTVAQKQQGNLHYYNFIEASGWLPSVSELRFERAKALLEVFGRQSASDNKQTATATTSNRKPQTPNCSIAPHASYSVSEDLWRRIQPYFQNKIASIHNQETAFEDEFFLQGTGDFSRMYKLMKIDNSHHVPTKKSSLQSYYDKLLGAEKIILVHNTFIMQADIDYVQKGSIEQPEPKGVTATYSDQLQTLNRKPQTFFCLCPNANQYIEGAMPPVDLFRANGCNIVLGTDSLASNWSLSILDEMKTIRNHFPHIPLEEMLCWATLNGAKALGMEDELGSFEKGKKGKMVLINEENLEVIKIL